MLNNKGTTLVELLVSFLLLMLLMGGMLSLIFSLKKTANNTVFKQDITDYKNTVVILIQEDVIRDKLSSIASCSSENLICSDLTFSNGSVRRIIIDEGSKTIRYDGIIYEMPNSSEISVTNSSITLLDNVFKIPVPIFRNKTNYGIELVSILNI